MAKKKKSFFGTLLKLGGLAAAGYAIYTKRDEIKSFVADAAERIFPEDAEIEPIEATLEPESDIVIDATEQTEKEETEESAAEE